MPRKVAVSQVPANRRRGGDLRTLLSPATTGSTSGFMGVASLEAGEYISEHYHPYSEEFLYVVSGSLLLTVDGVPVEMEPGEGIMLPVGTRHRLTNAGQVPVSVVFHLGPLAPRPELGHVDTEPYPEQSADQDPPAVGSPAPGSVPAAGGGFATGGSGGQDLSSAGSPVAGGGSAAGGSGGRGVPVTGHVPAAGGGSAAGGSGGQDLSAAGSPVAGGGCAAGGFGGVGGLAAGVSAAVPGGSVGGGCVAGDGFVAGGFVGGGGW